ncbi:MAG: molybdenum cofactor biosynthesis protein MoaB [Deltaproteobacteria bacterium]|nr:molybdenum cofactor biosynthesis protein MoaB [Deltaproteobacteria bacterium]
MGLKEHKKSAPKRVKIGIITVSTTRSLKDDKSGQWMNKRAGKEGHEVIFHEVVPDDMETIRQTVRDVIQSHEPDALLLTGGTGISRKDVTIEAIQPMFEKELTAFGPLFAQLSFEEIDSAALLSRAVAGVIGNTILFCMPGSQKACELACKAVIFPELGHLVKHVQEE